MSSNTPTVDAQAGGVQYSVKFVNNSSESGSACIYQTVPDGGVPNVMSLAWFAKMTHPTTRVSFRWTLDYCFVWAQTGQLMPGVIVDAGQAWPADLSSSNQVTFTNRGGAFTFQNQTAGPRPGSLSIRADASIPPGQAAVGIGMSGEGTLVTQAQPNWNLAFTPHPQYWIAFGNFTQGEALDVTQIPNPAQIQFPSGVYSMTATLNPDNTWTIQPTMMASEEE